MNRPRYKEKFEAVTRALANAELNLSDIAARSQGLHDEALKLRKDEAAARAAATARLGQINSLKYAGSELLGTLKVILGNSVMKNGWVQFPMVSPEEADLLKKQVSILQERLERPSGEL